MIKFIIGLLAGGFIGTMWMALFNIVDDIDELASEFDEIELQHEYCPVCGAEITGEEDMYVGMNNYSEYNPEYCDGHYCPRDCDKCSIADKIREENDDD